MYNEVANDYEDALNYLGGYKNPEIAVQAFMKKNYSKDIQILDMACGTGAVAEILKKEGYENITGIDGSENMLKLA